MNKKLRLFLIIGIFLSSIVNLIAQEIVPLSSRQTKNNIHGNLIMTGNSIVGLVDSDEDNIDYNPNVAYNGNLSNGASVTTYIDIDNDDSTFSSSSADVNVPSPDQSKIVYAGLYWGATYYIERISKETPSLKINNTSLAGDYEVNNNIFTQGSIAIPDGSGITANLVLVNDGLDTTEDGCTAVTNTTELDGNIAVIRRGSCSFTAKVINAQNAGAIAVIVVNTSDDTLSMSGEDVSITIPAVSINKTNGDAIIAQMETAIVNVTLMTKNSSDGDEQLSDLPLLDARKVGDADFRKIKFKVPGGSYNQVTAQNIIYDGYRDTPTNPSNVASDDVPYVCYAEVTNLIDQHSINGTYIVADMNATIGRTSGASGAAGGWTLVVIYENPLESVKFISTNDGFVQIQNSDPDVNFMYTGFMTPPAPLPVNVRYGIAALEGDRGLGATAFRPNGDQVLIQNAATPPAFIPLGENNFNTPDNFDINPTVNFFNSSITFNHQYVTTRNPASENTLGLDIDLFDLPNTGNTLVANNQDNASFRLSTDADTYRVFLNAFAIEVATPVKAELKVTKQVYAEDGVTDVANENIELGDELFYDLKIENVGTENLVDGSITITEQISDNLNIISVVDTTLPSGVTYSITLPNTLVFNIPATIVETTDAPIAIRYRVATVSSCEGLRDACSNEIKGIGTITYTGAVSNIARNNTFGAEITNFLVNIPACSSDISFCGDSLELIAGTGYGQYTWSGPGIATPIVTNTNILNVPNPQHGTYKVIKEDTAEDCMSLTEEFVVDGIRDIVNPILSYINGTNVISTNCRGLEVPQILLCGNQDFYLQTNFDPANLTSISWQRLVPSNACVLDNEDPCSFLSEDCTNANWVEESFGNGPDFSVFKEGDYRIWTEFEGGCSIPFYFSVFKTDYQPTLTATDIECGNDGSVTVTNAPVGYEFSLTQGGPYSPTITFPIPAGSGGDVTVYSIDTTLPTCEYTATINVVERNTFINVTTTDPTCINDDTGTGTGSIHIEVTDGSPIYSYTISSTTLVPPVNITVSNSNDPNFTFDNLVPDTYDVEVLVNVPNSGTTNCLDYSAVTINPAPPFEAYVTLVSPATCDSGALVQVNVLAGSGNYLYDDGSGNFQTNNVFEIVAPDPAKTYSFFVADNNLPIGTSACIINADISGLADYEPTVLDNVNIVQPTCFGDGGQVEVQVSPVVAGRIYTYQLLDTTDLDPVNPVYTVVDQIITTETIVTFANIADLTSYRIRVLHNDILISDGEPVCAVEGVDFAMTSPDSITASINVERALSCTPGLEDAIISISNIAGGSGAYEWSFEDTQGYTNITTTPFTIEIPTKGNYNIYIRNQETGNCITSFPVTIDPEANLIVEAQLVKDLDCTEATIAFTAEGGENFIYDLVFTSTNIVAYTNITSPFTIVNAGTYAIQATDITTNCSAMSNIVTVNEYTETNIILSSTDSDCTGDVGTITVIIDPATDGNPPYTYQIVQGPITTPLQVSPIFTELIPGVYEVIVVDGDGCASDSSSVVIDQSEFDDVVISTDEMITCFNPESITITVTGGIGPFNFEELSEQVPAQLGIVGEGTGAATVFELPTEGIYFFRITDTATGCTREITHEVAPFDTIDMSLRTIKNVVGCYGDKTGIVELTITGYAGEYAYHFSNDNNADFVGGIGNTSTNPVSIDGFSAGSYTVIIDALEAPFCPIQGSITITEPSLLNPVFTATNITCHGDNDGTILITVDPNDLESIGTPPYSYAISSMPGIFFNDAADGVQNQHLFEDLEPGVYTVLIQDANGCDVTFDYTMLEPQALQVSVTEITPESCHSDNLGAVTIAIDGGTPPYETNITNNDADFVVDKLTYNNLPSGTSVINVRDANGCRIEIEVNIPYGIDLDASLISRTECATIDPVTGEIIKDTLYYVDFVANNQNPLTGLIYTLQGINGTPNPDASQNLTGTFIVQPGEYKGSIESGNCEKSIGEITIQEHTTPLAVSIIGINPTNPGDTGEIIVKIDQGVGPYMLTLDDEITVDNIAGSYVFNDVVIGNHEVKVYDMAGCASETLTVEIQVVDKNPIIQYADEILLCTLTNQSYPVIEIQDRNGEELNIPFANIKSVVWQKLNEIDCDIELLYNCPTTSSNCSSDWFDVSTDKNFTVVDDGRYRVIVTFANKNENNTKVYYYRVINNLESINDELVVFPNPGREIVTINDEVKNIKLFNTIGKLVLETNKNKFNIIELEAGVYFARVVTANDEEKVVKLVKK